MTTPGQKWIEEECADELRFGNLEIIAFDRESEYGTQWIVEFDEPEGPRRDEALGDWIEMFYTLKVKMTDGLK